MTTWQEALEQYIARLAERSADTADNWSYTIRRFLRQVEVDMPDLTLSHIEAYRARLAERTRAEEDYISLATMNRYLDTLSLFLRYCAEHGWIPLRSEDIHAALKTRRAPAERA